MSDVGEVIVLLVEALDAAWTELEQLAETPCPVSDDVQAKCDEREALLATFSRAPADAVEALRDIFREERARGHHASLPDAKIPVMPEVLARLAELREELRRCSALDPFVREALRRSEAARWVW